MFPTKELLTEHDMCANDKHIKLKYDRDVTVFSAVSACTCDPKCDCCKSAGAANIERCSVHLLFRHYALVDFFSS